MEFAFLESYINGLRQYAILVTGFFQNVFQIHPYYSLCRFFILLLQVTIPLYGHTTVVYLLFSRWTFGLFLFWAVMDSAALKA